MKGLVHSDDPRLERINAFLPPTKKAPNFKFELLHWQVPRVHHDVGQFAQVLLSHGLVVVDDLSKLHAQSRS